VGRYNAAGSIAWLPRSLAQANSNHAQVFLRLLDPGGNMCKSNVLKFGMDTTAINMRKTVKHFQAFFPAASCEYIVACCFLSRCSATAVASLQVRQVVTLFQKTWFWAGFKSAGKWRTLHCNKTPSHVCIPGVLAANVICKDTYLPNSVFSSYVLKFRVVLCLLVPIRGLRWQVSLGLQLQPNPMIRRNFPVRTGLMRV